MLNNDKKKVKLIDELGDGMAILQVDGM